MTTPRAWITVDTNALRENVSQMRRIVGANVGILAVVKANAYGHGLVPVAKAFVQAGVEYLGVTQPYEGFELRESGVRTPILVLGPTDPWEIEDSIRHDLTLTTYSKTFPKLVSDAARAIGRPARVHLKVDTGMGRMGVWHTEALSVVEALLDLPGMVLEGMYTHFPNAEDDEEFTRQQIRDFRRLLDACSNAGVDVEWVHAANSTAALQYPEARFNMVRPGLALYGIRGASHVGRVVPIKPALSLTARITDVRQHPAGRSISYGRTYVTDSATRVATLPIGYADGYSWALSNRAPLLLHGRRATVTGRVCMDFTMVNVGHIDSVAVGDEVTLIGESGRQRVSVEELAHLSNTVPYEIICCLNARLPRRYLHETIAAIHPSHDTVPTARALTSQ